MEWPVYKINQKVSQSDTAYNTLSSKNQEALTKWLKEKSILSKCETRRGNRRRAIVKLLSFVKKDFDKITYEDYVNVASAISKTEMSVNQKNTERNFITRFLKDNFEDWEKKFKGLKLLELEKEKDINKLSPKDLLTELENDKLMKASSDMKKISLIALLSTTAGRPEEILKLKWCDVDFKNKLVYLYSAKTGKRRAVPIDNAINHLTRLKQETEGKEEDLIFPSPSNKIYTIAGLNHILQELSKKAGIKKRVWAYLFRHTRLSFLITKLSPKVYEEVAGHSLQMGMKTYAHLSQDKIIQEMREKVFDIQELKQDEKAEFENRIKALEEFVRKVSNPENDMLCITDEVEKVKKKL